MTRKRKKIVKMRGRKRGGHKKKRRGKGSRGGKGFAGSMNQKKLMVMKYYPERLGKHGFHSLRQRSINPSSKAINLRDIEKLAQGKPEINLADFGYDKVLASGGLKKPLKIKASYFSEKAKVKIEKAGGAAVSE